MKKVTFFSRFASSSVLNLSLPLQRWFVITVLEKTANCLASTSRENAICNFAPNYSFSVTKESAPGLATAVALKLYEMGRSLLCKNAPATPYPFLLIEMQKDGRWRRVGGTRIIPIAPAT